MLMLFHWALWNDYDTMYEFHIFVIWKSIEVKLLLFKCAHGNHAEQNIAITTQLLCCGAFRLIFLFLFRWFWCMAVAGSSRHNALSTAICNTIFAVNGENEMRLITQHQTYQMHTQCEKWFPINRHRAWKFSTSKVDISIKACWQKKNENSFAEVSWNVSRWLDWNDENLSNEWPCTNQT